AVAVHQRPVDRVDAGGVLMHAVAARLAPLQGDAGPVGVRLAVDVVALGQRVDRLNAGAVAEDGVATHRRADAGGEGVVGVGVDAGGVAVDGVAGHHGPQPADADAIGAVAVDLVV